MTSVGVQAQVTDPEGVLGLVKSFHAQLLELVQMNTTVVELNVSRGQCVHQSETLVRDLEGKIQGLADSSADMESMLRENQHMLEDQDNELEELTNRMEHLNSEIRDLERQAHTSESEDIDNEQRLTGFAVEELYRKMDTLAHLHHRLDRANQDRQEEWDQFKSDCNQQQENLRPYLEMKDHLDELTLARYVGMQSLKGAEQSERDLAERLSSHHWNKVLHRQLQQQLTESQIKQQDLEDEIGTLVAKKRDLWKKCLDLENCLDELKDETHPLRPSSAYADLPFVAEGGTAAESDSGDELDTEALRPDLECHGRLLHRCPKSTNIVVGPYLSTSADVNIENVTVTEDTEEKNLDSETKHDISAEAPSTSEEQRPDVEAASDQDDPDAENADDQSNTREISRAEAHRISGGEEHTSMVMKIRRRMGLGRHSSSQRIKGTKLTATGSSRGLTKDAVSRRRRN